MRKLLLFGLLVVKHYRKFGLEGIRFIYKRLFLKRRQICFRHPGWKYPLYLRNDTSDIHTFYQVVYDEDYKIELGFEPRVIVDLGANVGLASIYFANRYPQASIFAVEPEPANFAAMQVNTAPYANIRCFNYGAWSKTAQLLVEDSGWGHWAFKVKEVDYVNEQTIPAISVEALMRENQLAEIDVLKIDIEGSEKELFEENYEPWLANTKVIIIELHDNFRAGASASFFKALTRYDFRMTHREENVICYLNPNYPIEYPERTNRSYHLFMEKFLLRRYDRGRNA
jgi:FkbM family methyltransferase